MTEPRIVTADDLCDAVEAVQRAGLPVLIEQLGLDQAQGAEKAYTVPSTWAQVPTLTALQSAILPAAAVTSSGIVGAPVRRTTGWDATWRITVGMFDRGDDYHVTAGRVRTWAALVRAVGIANPTLGGIASGVRWAGETYRQYPQANVARTLGGCAVDFDVDVRNVADLGSLAPLVGAPQSSLTVR